MPATGQNQTAELTTEDLLDEILRGDKMTPKDIAEAFDLNPATPTRWLVGGVVGPTGRRVYLEHVRAGRRLLTSKAAVQRFAVCSGESGPHTLQETCARICRSKGLDLSALGDTLNLCFDMPTLTDLGSMGEFAAALVELEAQVAVLDPLYLMLGADVDAANLFSMGAALRSVGEVLLKAGVSPILLHHANKRLQVGEPMELTDLSYSGLEQFLRQYLFVSRRTKFTNDGAHDLWLRVGGSAGHGGLWSLHVSEGVVGDDFGGRTWEVGLMSAGEAHADLIERRAEAKEEAARKQMQKDEGAVLEAIRREVAAGLPGATKARMRAFEPTLSGDKVNDTIERLLGLGDIEEVRFEKSGGNRARQTVVGYRVAQKGDGWNGRNPPTPVLPFGDAAER